MFCPKCGAANDDMSNFCKNCSQPLAAARDNLQNPTPATPNTPAPQYQANPNTNPNSFGTTVRVKNGLKPWMVILPVIFGLVILFFVIDALTSSDSDAVDDGTSTIQTDGNTNEEIPSDANTEESVATQSVAADLPDLATLVSMDVFDWSAASDEEKINIAFAIQMQWQIGGITGDAIDMSSSDLVAKISERMGDQAGVFESACAVFDIEPQSWTDMVS